MREIPKDNNPTALTISGSDSGGGAGIQADLKTFAALGVHGMSVVTTITAQNTQRILAVYDVPPTMIKSQLDAVFEDMRVDVVKIGMLHTMETIDIVTQEVKNRTIPVVVDPVMTAKSGRTLLKREALGAFSDKILPLATVLTPNAPEAHSLSGVEVDNLEDAKKAAIKLAQCGPQAVIIKGGHLPHTDGVVDVLYTDGEFELFQGDFIDSSTTHGTGCSYASAVAAGLAKHLSIRDAVRNARDLVTKAIKFGFPIGKGYGPVNPTAWLQNEAERYATWKNVADATLLLEAEPTVVYLVPEVQINLVMATPYASTLHDIVGIPGRITRRRTRVRSSSCPEFGASRHVASTILTAQDKDPSIRAGMNIRYSPEIIQLCTKLGFQVAFYDRRKEPESLKAIEGETIPWGTKSAIESVEGVPDIIYHLGDWGKEPMITILASSAVAAVQKAIRIAKNLNVTSR